MIKSLHSIQDTEEPNFRRILSHRYNKSADWARASVNAMAKPGFIPGSIEFAFGDKNGAKHDWIHSPSQFGRDLYRCWNSKPFQQSISSCLKDLGSSSTADFSLYNKIKSLVKESPHGFVMYDWLDSYGMRG